MTQIIDHWGEYGRASGWNMLDIAGVAALYTSVSAHTAGLNSVLAYSGALGVLFNFLSILQLLRPYEVTGPVIKMTTTILLNGDIKGFLCVSLLLLVGFSAAFTVCMPESQFFGFNGQHGGPAYGFLVVFQFMLGTFELDNYTHPVAIMMFVLFAFVMVLVLLNLLIAMMNDCYNDVKQQSLKEVEKLRAETIMSLERRLFKWQRKKMMADLCFAEYLQQLVPAKPHVSFAKLDQEELLQKLQQDVKRLQESQAALQETLVMERLAKKGYVIEAPSAETEERDMLDKLARQGFRVHRDTAALK